MKKSRRFFDIICIGGQSLKRVPLSLAISDSEEIIAPKSLLRKFNKEEQFGKWFLNLLPEQKSDSKIKSPALLLWRRLSAAAFDPRIARLQSEKEQIDILNKESDYVKVVTLDMNPVAPEMYKATFYCRGIVGINPSREPIYGEMHEVEIKCDYNFPADPPKLKWLTNIWHPNIHHRTRDVCINAKEWLGGMTIVDLCRQLFEMIQYRNYHAIQTKPHPLDSQAAKWVVEYAEPHGILNKKRGVFVDNKSFTRPDSPFSENYNGGAGNNIQRIHLLNSPSKIKILRDLPNTDSTPSKGRIKIIS